MPTYVSHIYYIYFEGSALCWDDFQNIHSSRHSFSVHETQNENLVKNAYSKHELYAFHLRRFFGTTQTLNKNNFEVSLINLI